MYSTVLFDLDGTLTDSGKGIINSAKYALKQMNHEVPDDSELRKFIGPPLVDSFRNYCGFTNEQAHKAVYEYRVYYKEKGIFENEVYNGVRDMLCSLKENGKKIILATSKPEVFARIVLDHFDLTKYFDFIAGALTDETRNTKAQIIEHILKSCDMTDTSDLVMVGDREHDVIGAKEHGIDCIGVLYGYGSRAELETAGAKFIAKTPTDVVDIAINR